MWVCLALAAGSLQTVRNALARSVAREITPALNSWSRFAFNLPWSTLLVAILVARVGVPETTPRLLLLCLATGATQLLGNLALVAAFRRSSFAESIVLHKLEVVLAALVGVALFAETPSLAGWLALVVSVFGVLLMNLARGDGPSGWRRALHLDEGALLALACAALLVAASFLLKLASTEFALANPRVGAGRFEAAAHTLFHTTWMEVAILTVVLVLRYPGELSAVRRYWRRMALIGASGFAGSLCWFWAYAVAIVAYVKALGQVEAVLAVAISLRMLGEREVARQLPGMALVAGGIVALVLLG